ncbi:MAG: hypothetical protein JRI68_18885 [Deltaproteobacteria bacterium]|nr:hypothetical protein [Deltaproteobacteria bacterium]
MAFLFVAALAARLLWTLYLHPPSLYVYSDMEGYVLRAERFLAEPLGSWPDAALYPFGTHYLLALCGWVFGSVKHTGTAVVFAALGAGLAPLCFCLTGRLVTGPSWPAAADGSAPGQLFTIARVAGWLAVAYYPLLSLTGYYLSETPYALLLTAAALLTLRLADLGRARDAWLLGVVVALGITFRHQLLLGLAMVLLFALWRRRSLPRLRLGLLVPVVLPIAIVLLAAAARTHHHSGRVSLVSQNASLNRVFGRCHYKLVRGRDATFGPPSFDLLDQWAHRYPWQPLKLLPAKGLELRVPVPLTDVDALNDVADDCVAHTGLVRQARYALSHVALLWVDAGWPDGSQPRWLGAAQSWRRVHLVLLFVPLWITLFAGLGKGRAREGLLGLYVWSLVLLAMLFFGSGRIRAPYDGIIIALAIGQWGRWFLRLQGWRARRLVAEGGSAQVE